jgi:hypothetical protein
MLVLAASAIQREKRAKWTVGRRLAVRIDGPLVVVVVVVVLFVIAICASHLRSRRAL